MRVLEGVKVSDFFLPQHQKIFTAMKRLAAAQTPIDTIMLIEDLEQEGDLEGAGGIPYISELADGLPRISNVEHYCAIVKEKAALRKIIHLTDALQQSAYAGQLNDDAVRALLEATQTKLGNERQLGSLSTAELFTAQDSKVEWLAFPFAAVGLSTITDASPKVGKTELFLQGTRASREERTFLGVATKPMRLIYVSEQSAASLAVQARQVGFTGDEPLEELRWISREHWSRFTFPEFLERLEKQFMCNGSYNALIFDTWHTIARLEDENDASETNRLGNFTLDIAARNKLALSLGRHDRKSGGEVGASGRGTIQLSGLVDVILHLVRVPDSQTKRRLEMVGRIPGLPSEQIIELTDDGRYINLGAPLSAPEEADERVSRVAEWLLEFPGLTAEEIVSRFARFVPPVEISLATAKRYRAKARER